MSDNSLIIGLFFGIGYVLAVAALSVWYFLGHRPVAVLRMSRIANGVLAFYALCMGLTGSVSLISALAGHKDIPAADAYRFVGRVLIPLALVVTLFFLVKKKPLLLFIPLGILINIGTGDWTLTEAVLTERPYILLLMGALFFLLVVLLYLVSLWIRRVLK